MVLVREITMMCREGRLDEAYTLAKESLAAEPENVWAQRGMAWALYYQIKADAESGNLGGIIEHFEELLSLDMLSAEEDDMIFSNAQLQIAMFVNLNSAALFLAESFYAFRAVFQPGIALGTI